VHLRHRKLCALPSPEALCFAASTMNVPLLSYINYENASQMTRERKTETDRVEQINVRRPPRLVVRGCEIGLENIFYTT